jgi:hypothetical protein
LIVAFDAQVTRLIQLYILGVFLSFTLSQAGMVRHHQKEREQGWQRGVVVNATGSVATFIVLVIVATTKFTEGAYIVVIIVPIVMAMFAAVKRHYVRVSAALTITPEEVRPEPENSIVVVLVGTVRRGEIKALRYAKSMRPNHLAALHVAYEDADTTKLEQQWRDFAIEVPLEVVHSPYRELVDGVMSYLDELEDRWGKGTMTVVIPEFVVGHWYEQTLHNQSALAIKLALLFRENTVVVSVPYHVGKSLPKKDIGSLVFHSNSS